MASDLTTWINSFRGKKLRYGLKDAALAAHIYAKIGILFTKYVVDKTRFTRRNLGYVVIAMETNVNIIICVPPTQNIGLSTSLQMTLQDATVILSLIYQSLTKTMQK